MELRDYLLLLYQWFWLLILGAVICGLSGYIILQSNIEASKYRATATMMIGSELMSTELDVDTTELIQATAVEMTKRTQLSEAIIERLSLSMPAGELRNRYSIKAIPGTRLIEILVDDANPERAAAIANAVTTELELLTATTVIGGSDLGPKALNTIAPAIAPSGTRLSSAIGIPIASLLGLVLTIGLILLFEYIEDIPIVKDTWQGQQRQHLG